MQRLPGFLIADDLELLRATCASFMHRSTAYQTDRGAFYVPVDPIPASLLPLRARAELALGAPPNDCFFLIYGPHDAATPHLDARRTIRLIALLTGADQGGELIISGAPAQLEVGDAVVFSPETEVHEVTAVTGRRVVWSMGVRSDRGVG